MPPGEPARAAGPGTAADRYADADPAPAPSPTVRLPLLDFLYGLLIVALIGGIVACAVLLRRRRPGRGRAARLAQWIWRMEQQAIRFPLPKLGIPVVHWDGQQSLDLSLAPLTRRVMVTRR